MAGNRRARDGEARGDLSGSQVALLQFLKNLPPGRIGQRAECAGHCLHVSILAILLNSVKRNGEVVGTILRFLQGRNSGPPFEEILPRGHTLAFLVKLLIYRGI